MGLQKLPKIQQEKFIWQNENLWLLSGFVLALKCLLINCYHSTDFEVNF